MESGSPPPMRQLNQPPLRQLNQPSKSPSAALRGSYAPRHSKPPGKPKLYQVVLEYTIPVLATDEKDAIDTAETALQRDPYSIEEFHCVSEIHYSDQGKPSPYIQGYPLDALVWISRDLRHLEFEEITLRNAYELDFYGANSVEEIPAKKVEFKERSNGQLNLLEEESEWENEKL
jgi:hypothetical protein